MDDDPLLITARLRVNLQLSSALLQKAADALHGFLPDMAFEIMQQVEWNERALKEIE